jgi:S1-C subfamily serine protease
MGQETGAQGISFAIPASVVRRVIDEIIEYGQVTRGWMGVELSDVSLRLSTAETLQPGARVSEVHRGSPAWMAGLQRGDVLVSADGREVESARELMQRIAGSEPGSDMELEVVRGNQLFTTSVELIQQPPPQD